MCNHVKNTHWGVRTELLLPPPWTHSRYPTSQGESCMYLYHFDVFVLGYAYNLLSQQRVILRIWSFLLVPSQWHAGGSLVYYHACPRTATHPWHVNSTPKFAATGSFSRGGLPNKQHFAKKNLTLSSSTGRLSFLRHPHTFQHTMSNTDTMTKERAIKRGGLRQLRDLRKDSASLKAHTHAHAKSQREKKKAQHST